MASCPRRERPLKLFIRGVPPVATKYGVTGDTGKGRRRGQTGISGVMLKVTEKDGSSMTRKDGIASPPFLPPVTKEVNTSIHD